MFDCLLSPWSDGRRFPSTHNESEWGYVMVEERWRRPLDEPRAPTDYEIETTVPGKMRSVGRQLAIMRYNKESRTLTDPQRISQISAQCLSLLITNPLFAVARIVYYVLRLVLEPLYTIYEALSSFARQFPQDGFFLSAMVTIKDFCILGTLRTMSCLWEIVRTPFFTLGIQLAALEGAFYDPLKGAHRIGYIEAKFNHISYMSGVLRRSHDMDVRVIGPLDRRAALLQVPSFQIRGTEDDIIDTLTHTTRYKILTRAFKTQEGLVNHYRRNRLMYSAESLQLESQ